MSPAPRLIECVYGRWLAVSPVGCSIAIGVFGQTAEEARANYAESFARWVEILASKPHGKRMMVAGDIFP